MMNVDDSGDGRIYKLLTGSRYSSVATYCRLGGNICDTYIDNFLRNLLVKEF